MRERGDRRGEIMQQGNRRGTIEEEKGTPRKALHVALLIDGCFHISEMNESLDLSGVEKSLHTVHSCECRYYSTDRSNYYKHIKRTGLTITSILNGANGMLAHQPAHQENPRNHPSKFQHDSK